MDRESKHTSNQKQSTLNKGVLSRMDIPFKRDKDEVWESIANKMDAPSEAPIESSRRLPAYMYVAASFIVLLAVASLFLSSYSYTEFTGNEMSNIILPDGSTIEAKDNTEVSFHPYWWRFKREVKLEGEGYFKVEEGATFSVISSKGITEVLGTTFTVYTRSEQYKVSCYSGSVKVRSKNNTVSATLIANEEIMVDKNGNYNVSLINENDTPAAIEEQYYFIFNSTPIQEVFRQIASYYNVGISVSSELDYDFSGNLNRDLSIQDILDAVCIPFDIKYAKYSNTEYTIKP